MDNPDDKVEKSIDFTPILREAQVYAKVLQDIVEKDEMTEEQYESVLMHRISLADTFCHLIFGHKFDEIRKKYMDFVTKNINNMDDEMQTLTKQLKDDMEKEVEKRVSNILTNK